MSTLRNTSLDAPEQIEITDYDAEFGETARRIMVDGGVTGTLVVEDINGSTSKHTFVSLAAPYELVGQFKKVVGDGSGGVGDGTLVGGTDIAIADLTAWT